MGCLIHRELAELEKENNSLADEMERFNSCDTPSISTLKSIFYRQGKLDGKLEILEQIIPLMETEEPQG